MGRPESADVPNRMAQTPNINVRVDQELDRWLMSQVLETGLSKAAVVRFHLERAMGTPTEAALLKQLVMGSYGDMRTRIALALSKARTVIADVISVALAANPDEIDDAITQSMREHITEHDPERGFPAGLPYHKDTTFGDAPRKRKQRRGKRGRGGE